MSERTSISARDVAGHDVAAANQPAHRSVYRHAELHRTISPKSVVVIGASGKPGSFGFNTAAHLAGYPGTVYLVNDRYQEIGGRKCYPSVDALPEVPDCAILAVPRQAVEPVLRQCAEFGVGGAVVFASGYAEAGGEQGAADQERLTQLARETGLRIIGPNCVGVLNHAASLRMTFAGGMDVAFAGAPGIGIASQSGGMGNAVAQVSRFGTSITHMLSAGNSCDVDVADYVAYLAEEESCSVIVCLFEGLSDPLRFVEAGKIAQAQDKPLIVCKIATSAAGEGAAMSHTGVLAGSNAAWEAAFREVNAVVVDNLESLARTATFFLRVARPSKGSAIVLASSGGFCTVAVDKAELFGVELSPPSPELGANLAELIPEFGNIGNPTDMTAQHTPDGLQSCYEAVLAGTEYDTVISPVTFAGPRTVDRVARINAAATAAGKVACLVWTPAWINGPGFQEAMESSNLATFLSMEDCLRTVGAWQGYERARRNIAQAPASSRVAIGEHERKAAGELLRSASGGAALSERESKTVLRQYGLPMTADRLTTSEGEAIAAAREIGFPVVLKLEIDGLAHKTEAGGVFLDLRSEEDVRSAYKRLDAIVAEKGLESGFRGVLVQPMVGKGIEIIAGARLDPQFGPIVVVGIGGTFVEVLKDSATDFAPLTRQRAHAMLKRLRGHKLLTGVRGLEPVNVDRLADILCRLSEFAADHADYVAEIDINPLICAGDSIIAVDALVVRSTRAG